MQVRKKLEKAEEVKDDHYRLKQNYETLKHTCLELQDQVADYDRLTEKLEKSIGEARSASDAARKEASEKVKRCSDAVTSTQGCQRLRINRLRWL